MGAKIVMKTKLDLILSILINTFHRLWDFLHYLCCDGSWTLFEHEKALISAVLDYLDEPFASLVKSQLEKSYFIERMNGRICVFRFYAGYIKDHQHRIKDAAFEDLLLKVSVNVDGKKETMHVTFYEGYLFSMEFKQPSGSYRNKSVQIQQVKLGKSKETYTIEIDREEHG